MSVDPYELFQVSPKATQTVVQAAYQALVKEFFTNQKALQNLNIAKALIFEEDDRRKFDATYGKPVKKPGKVFGEYRILRKIAEGGFGTTYEAEHVSLGTKVCIKHALEINPVYEMLILEEAKIMWDLRHGGIPAIRDIIRLPDNSMALVMSFIPGLNIVELLEKYPDGLEAEHVAWITDRTLNVLKYLHYHGVIHGDMKPQNIMVQAETHEVVLVDYGLSMLKPKGQRAKGMTECFSAPEQEEGKPIVPETDFYGLGKTMIYALGGDVETVKVPGDTPDGMMAFIKNCIRNGVDKRPNWTRSDVQEDFRKVRVQDFGKAFSGMKPLRV